MGYQNAIKIEIIDASTENVIATLYFKQDECVIAEDVDIIKTRVDRTQTGKPTLFILGEEWQRIKLRIRLKYLDTLNKLLQIYNAAKSGQYFRVWPHFMQDQTLFWDCLMNPAQYARERTVFGHKKAGDVIEIEMLERTKENYVAMDDDIVI